MVGIGPDLALKDGIAAVRWLLQQDVRIHPRCSEMAGPKDCDGVEALRSYHREWDDNLKCFRETPVHDWSSHTADAARYLACVARVSADMTKPDEARKPSGPRPLDSFTLDELWDASGGPTRRERV
jgi:phage terminase large subunit